MDPLTLAVGAGILAAGALVGHITGRISAARQRPEKPQEPICGCGHHRSMHADGGEDRCTAAIWRETRSSTTGTWLGKQPHDCACKQYVGPEPITAFWTPPIAAEEG